MKSNTFSLLVLFCVLLLANSEEFKRKDYSIFDKKTKSFDPYFTGYYGKFGLKICNTNLPIQLSIILSENPLQLTRLMSPMNMITCNNKKVAYSCDKVYTDFDAINEDLIFYKKYLNENGSQYLDSFPYEISNKNEGKFNDCVSKNEIDPLVENQIVEKNYNNGDINKRNNDMKNDIYNYGSLLGLYNAPEDFDKFTASFANKGIFTSEKEGVAYVALRIVGWKTIDNKEYWIFSYTDDKFGFFNYGYIDTLLPINFLGFSILKQVQ